MEERPKKIVVRDLKKNKLTKLQTHLLCSNPNLASLSEVEGTDHMWPGSVIAAILNTSINTVRLRWVVKVGLSPRLLSVGRLFKNYLVS